MKSDLFTFLPDDCKGFSMRVCACFSERNLGSFFPVLGSVKLANGFDVHIPLSME